jgi:hypothetical protein
MQEIFVAKHHLEQAWYLGQSLKQEEIKFKSASLLARLVGTKSTKYVLQGGRNLNKAVSRIWICYFLAFPIWIRSSLFGSNSRPRPFFLFSTIMASN